MTTIRTTFLASALALSQALNANDRSSFRGALMNNPLTRTIKNTYDFFYWYPRRNLPYDTPWVLFKNNTAQFIAWYQFPHNLPPYRYVGTEEFGYPKDFFCYGLAGNILPLGDWDPCGFQLVCKKVVRKYRESELKHGRLAMLAITGFLIQESFHPFHPNIGGLAITHMDQLACDFTDLIFPRTISIPIDFSLVLIALITAETFALIRNWSRWERNEYNHQFDHNIGVGNLKEVRTKTKNLSSSTSILLLIMSMLISQDYINGDYGIDFFHLLPSTVSDPDGHRDMLEKELSHCRLAMVAIIGVIGQEYLTGTPAFTALYDWLFNS